MADSVNHLHTPSDALTPWGVVTTARLPASLVEPLFAADGWMQAPSPMIASALAAAAPNTRHAWAADWGVFRDWCLGPATRHVPERHARVTLPVAPELLAHFIRDQTTGAGTADGRPRRLTTLRRYLSTLATLHRLLELPDPTKHPLVTNTVKAQARGSGGAGQAAPLRWSQITAILPLLPDTLAGWRDRALLAVGHNTLARRAELVALDVEDLDWLDEGVATVALRPTKTDLEARVDVRYLSPPATALVRGWLERSRLEEGPLFTRMQRNGQARLLGRSHGQRLGVSAVNDILKEAVGRLAEARGELVIPPETPESEHSTLRRAQAADWSGHSLRVGAAQDMAALGVETAAILQAGGWKDVRMIKRYLRQLSALEGGMAQWWAAQHSSPANPGDGR
ncbi:tyrosine-type recombinase/integrase [Allochromatium palmeri]|uniref:tyrosine-type recombinase/integrase n=1 Tax=Allochromatium palmeri TaxID=231048 RepID=UPI001FEA6EA3|nr:tyrosine-type recombinase/integrase [Allochromatium palmeri]